MCICAGPIADAFELSATSNSISLQWTVPLPLQYYHVIDSYNISYWEKGATDIQGHNNSTRGQCSGHSMHAYTVSISSNYSNCIPELNMSCHSLSSIALEGLALGFGPTHSHNFMNALMHMPTARCVHGVM